MVTTTWRTFTNAPFLPVWEAGCNVTETLAEVKPKDGVSAMVLAAEKFEAAQRGPGRHSARYGAVHVASDPVGFS